MGKLISIAVLPFLLLLQGSQAGTCSSSTVSSVGCVFYAATLSNPALDQEGFSFAIHVQNVDNAAVEVSVTGGALSAPISESVPVGGAVWVELPWVSELSEATTTLLSAGGAYRISTTGPVTVVQYNSSQPVLGPDSSLSNDGSLLFPVARADTAFRILAWPTMNLKGTQYPGYAAIVATEDATTVQIQATSNVVLPGAGLGGLGGTVSIDRGDVLFVASVHDAPVGDSGSDLSGTTINSDRPVLVMAGHALAGVPSASTAFADHLEGSLPPHSLWGTRYIVARPESPNGIPSDARHVVRITANNTVNLSTDPAVPGVPPSISAGQVAELEAAVDFILEADGPILVASYMEGGEVFGGPGDPAMAFVVPVSLAHREGAFSTPLAIGAGIATLSAPTGSTVYIDGDLVSGWSTVGNSDFSIARVALCCTDVHEVTGSEPVSVSVYSYPDDSSFYYPAGFRLEDILFSDRFEP
jgi:hypothetical protein